MPPPLPEQNAVDLAEVIPCSVIRNIGSSMSPIAPRGPGGPPGSNVLPRFLTVGLTRNTVAVRMKSESQLISGVMQVFAIACHRYPIFWQATLQFHNSPLSSQIESRSAEIGAICNIVLKMGFSPIRGTTNRQRRPTSWWRPNGRIPNKQRPDVQAFNGWSNG